MRAGEIANHRDNTIRCPRRPVRPVGRQRIINISNRRNRSEIMDEGRMIPAEDLIALQPARVATAILFFVMLIGHLRNQ